MLFVDNTLIDTHVILFVTVTFLSSLLLLLSEGKVVKITRESIHVIVLGFASAVITSEDIREEFRYKTVSDSYFFVLVLNKYSCVFHWSIGIGNLIFSQEGLAFPLSYV